MSGGGHSLRKAAVLKVARVRELPLPPGTALMVGSAPPKAAGARDLDGACSARRGPLLP